MIEKFEYKGIWWLPNKPNKQVSGTLTFTPEKGAILELIGSFKDLKDMDKMLSPDIILGVSSSGKDITLYRCFETQSNLNLPSLSTSSFYANIVFVGAHFQKNENIRFRKLSIYYSNLDEWVNITGFKIGYDEKEVTIKYNLPEPIQARIDDNFKLFIDFRVKGPTHSIVQKEATIKQSTYIRIEPLEEKSFDEYMNVLYHIQNFLTLGITKPVYPLVIEGITAANKKILNGKTYYPSVKVFYKVSDISKTCELLLPFYMLFTFSYISDKFEFFLRNWFKKVDLLKPVYDLYFGTLYNPRMYLEHRFLSLIQAIESYHQRTYGGKYLSDEDYKEVYNALVNAIPSDVRNDLRDRLKRYLKYGNEFSLRKRLEEIFDKYREILNVFIEKESVFIDKVVNTRHYLTHYDEKLKEQAANGEELYNLTQKLKILLEICLLTELGFSLDEIKRLFSENRRYKMASI
ncbi:HEPN domain-containing protein [Caldicellulosiruptor sp. F32]|uniref:ApeA N-terminal domain 1-containing protein n=1 Tax=Caldicellulosiruptor sp. F32 TaxID=1214564 RepID=UPI00039A5957|nr:HEPN domain-containing protein [Caldicellulosiruptor sp. F32]